MPGPTVTTKTKDQLEVELYTIVIQPKVINFINTHRKGTWEIVAIVQQAVYKDGFTEELIRAHFRKALLEAIPDIKSDEFKSYQATINRAIRLGVAFSEKELERKRKDKTFAQICADLAIAKEVRRDMANEDGDKPDVNLGTLMQEAGSKLKPKSKPKKETKGWIAPNARFKASSKDADDWQEESLAIISEQFSRFITMIKEAMEVGELTDEKITQLHAILQGG
jgi:hypothetical protein